MNPDISHWEITTGTRLPHKTSKLPQMSLWEGILDIVKFGTSLLGKSQIQLEAFARCSAMISENLETKKNVTNIWSGNIFCNNSMQFHFYFRLYVTKVFDLAR